MLIEFVLILKLDSFVHVTDWTFIITIVCSKITSRKINQLSYMYVINHFPSKVDFLLFCVLLSGFMNLRSGLVKTQWNETHRYLSREITRVHRLYSLPVNKQSDRVHVNMLPPPRNRHGSGPMHIFLTVKTSYFFASMFFKSGFGRKLHFYLCLYITYVVMTTGTCRVCEQWSKNCLMFFFSSVSRKFYLQCT